MLKSERASQNQKSCCCKPRKKKNFVAAPGCTDDDAAVAALPDKWVPRHAGPILSNYLKSQEQNHQIVLEEISKSSAKINEDIDSKIRNLAESLLAHIKQNELDINRIVDQVNPPNKVLLSPEERNEALKQIGKLHAQRIEDMAAFRRDALTLERQRADELRKLLREQFQRLVKVGHRPPRDLLHEFDQETYDINQQLLSNSRAYAELEAELQAQADASLVRAKSNLNQMCLGVSIHRRHSAFPWCHDKQHQTRPTTASIDSQRHSADPSIGRIIGHVEEYDECFSLIVQAYRTAVMKVFSGFTGKLFDLHKDLGCYSQLLTEPKSSEAEDLQAMIERILERLSINIKTNTLGNLPELLDATRFDTLKMQKSLWSLGERLRDTYTILHDAGHLWDAHMLRSGLAQKLTMACVEDLVTHNDTMEMANEVTYNIALEQLRGAADSEKLQHIYEGMVLMLERTEDMYKQHSEAELGKLEEFMNFPETMANILMSEFHCFLEKYPRTSQKTGSTLTLPNNISPRLEENTLKMPLPRVILQTELQEAALLNWRNGFLETFESNVYMVPDELKRHARLWVEEKSRALRMRSSMKLVSHSIRMERLKAARDKRLAELKYHEARLDSHLEAVYELVDRLPFESSGFLSLDAPELYPFCGWLDDIQAKIDALLAQDPLNPETKRLKMSSYAPRLVKHRSLFERSLNVAMAACKLQIENRVQEARISNVRFASQLKLFSEGGRYSAQEATRACSALMRGADAIESCLTRSIDALNHRRSQLMALADQRLVPLQRLVDEFAKSGGKGGGIDKRKPMPGKKK